MNRRSFRKDDFMKRPFISSTPRKADEIDFLLETRSFKQIENQIVFRFPEKWWWRARQPSEVVVLLL